MHFPNRLKIRSERVVSGNGDPGEVKHSWIFLLTPTAFLYLICWELCFLLAHWQTKFPLSFVSLNNCTDSVGRTNRARLRHSLSAIRGLFMILHSWSLPGQAEGTEQSPHGDNHSAVSEVGHSTPRPEISSVFNGLLCCPFLETRNKVSWHDSECLLSIYFLNG